MPSRLSESNSGAGLALVAALREKDSPAFAETIVTQLLGISSAHYNNSPVCVYYETSRAKWQIVNENSAVDPTGAQFFVMVTIKQ